MVDESESLNQNSFGFSETESKEKTSVNAKSHRTEIIRSVKTPLGFLVLAALIIEAALLGLIPLATGLDRTLLISGFIVLLTILIVGVLFVYIRHNSPFHTFHTDHVDLPISSESKHEMSGRLIEEVRELYMGEQFLDTIRFGIRISRVLWLSGRYNERIAIGKMIEDSAARLQMTEKQVQSLIDDIGWTYFLVGNAEEAEANISHGIELAMRNKLFYLAAKGERHLAGIADRHRNDLAKAKDHLLRAKNICKSIPTGEQHDEMLGGLSYALSEFCLSMNRPTEALNNSLQAKKLYESNPHQEDRAVKIHSQLGRIHLKLNKLQQARDYFRHGLECAKRFSRPDEQGMNLLGLGQVYLEERNWTESIHVLEEAEKIFGQIGLRSKERSCTDLRRKAEDNRTKE